MLQVNTFFPLYFYHLTIDLKDCYMAKCRDFPRSLLQLHIIPLYECTIWVFKHFVIDGYLEGFQSSAIPSNVVINKLGPVSFWIFGTTFR